MRRLVLAHRVATVVPSSAIIAIIQLPKSADRSRESMDSIHRAEHDLMLLRHVEGLVLVQSQFGSATKQKSIGCIQLFKNSLLTACISVSEITSCCYE